MTNRLYRLCGFIIAVMLFCSCDEQKLNPDRLLGKTRIEVLELAFNHFRKSPGKEINIMIETSLGKNHNFYYENITEALNDERLMQAERWELFAARKTSFSVFCQEIYIELFFKDQKVVKYVLNTWNKT